MGIPLIVHLMTICGDGKVPMMDSADAEGGLLYMFSMIVSSHLKSIPKVKKVLHAKVAELVDALDLGSSGVSRESSSLSFRT